MPQSGQTGCRWWRRSRPALANAAHQLQPAFGQTQARVERFKPPLDVVAGDDFVRQRIAERFEADMLVVHRFRIAANERLPEVGQAS